jgi:hypothetical protein
MKWVVAMGGGNGWWQWVVAMGGLCFGGGALEKGGCGPHDQKAPRQADEEFQPLVCLSLDLA